MAVKDKSVREAQIASYGDAVAKRYAFLKEKGSERSVVEKDPILKHLKAELSRRQRRLLAVTNKVKPKPVPVVKEPPKEEEKPKEKPKKKEKTKKPAAE
jgi:outer membrane biosynthesis protein TonB